MPDNNKDSVDVRPDAQIHGASQSPPIAIDKHAPSEKLLIGPLQIYALLGYYTAWLTGSIALLAFLVAKEKSIEPELKLLVLLGFASSGAIVGSVLYQIRMLFKYYVKDDNFDRKWLAKYITAPIESVALALAILSLIQGGGIVLGGHEFDLTAGGKSFTVFGLGALIGFGIREVVGWLGNLAKSTFPTDHKE